MLLIEETIHQEEIPKVDQTIDIYSVIAKFLNSIKYDEPVVFPLSKTKFIELHVKLHELTTGSKFFPTDDIKEFEGTFEGRPFTFIKIIEDEK
jgi:hypothetical protein